MPAVVSNRVQAGPKDKLPPGAAEAEFAFHKAQAIRSGYEYLGEHPYFLSKRDDEVLIPGQGQKSTCENERYKARERREERVK